MIPTSSPNGGRRPPAGDSSPPSGLVVPVAAGLVVWAVIVWLVRRRRG